MIYDNYDMYFHKLFPTALRIFITSGMQEGVIIKFRTFYLKIYDDHYSYGYYVEAYHYSENIPMFKRYFTNFEFKRFADKIKNADILHRHHHKNHYHYIKDILGED